MNVISKSISIHTNISTFDTGDKFVNYLKNILIPTLNKGDIIIMDNMRSHHVKAVREIIEDAGMTLLYLPPYSPDFNPIEEMLSKIKAVLRKLMIRVLSDLPACLGNFVDCYSHDIRRLNAEKIGGDEADCNIFISILKDIKADYGNVSPDYWFSEVPRDVVSDKGAERCCTGRTLYY